MLYSGFKIAPSSEVKILFSYSSVKQIIPSSLDALSVLSTKSRQKKTQNTADPFFSATYSNWNSFPLKGTRMLILAIA